MTDATTPPGEPVPLAVRTDGLQSALADMTRLTERFGTTFAGTMRRAAMDGRPLDDTLRTIGQRLSAMALESAFRPIDTALGQLAGSLAEAAMSGLTGGSPGLPQAAAGAARPASVTFNVTAADAPSFARSEGQLAAMLARTVRRGERML